MIVLDQLINIKRANSARKDFQFFIANDRFRYYLFCCRSKRRRRFEFDAKKQGRDAGSALKIYCTSRYSHLATQHANSKHPVAWTWTCSAGPGKSIKHAVLRRTAEAAEQNENVSLMTSGGKWPISRGFTSLSSFSLEREVVCLFVRSTRQVSSPLLKLWFRYISNLKSISFKQGI